MTVAELLTASQRAHQAARQQVAGPVGAKKVKKPLDLVKLREAYDLRKQAIDLDPEREDNAWAEEQVSTAAGRDTHVLLMDFYRDKLGLDG